MAVAPAVDRSVLDALMVRLGDRGPALWASLLGTWQGEAGGRREELARVAAAGDAAGLAKIAHTLRSSAGALGARRLATLCADVEEAVRAGDPVDLTAAAAEITTALADADAAFAELARE